MSIGLSGVTQAYGFVVSLTLLSFGSAACTQVERGKDVADAPARRVLLKNLSEQVILPAYEDFARAAMLLEAACGDHLDALTDSTRLQAQGVFRDAMLAWERAELFQLGPAAEISNFNPGGAGLRAEIYAWDQDDPCVVDRGLVKKLDESADFEKDVYFYGRGLGAVGRLLFDRSKATACAESDRVATPSAWQELLDRDLDERRARYALRCSEVIRARAKQLVSAFRDDFMPQLVSAGSGSRLFDRTQEALNTLTNALFYVDVEMRDLKIGGPIGRTMACMDKACPTELSYAQLSREALLANLTALEAAFVGAAPDGERGSEMWGLSDLLRSVNAGATADEVEASIAAAVTAVEALGNGFDQAPQAASEQGVAAFEALQALSDVLNTELLQKLALSPPMRASGDND